MAFDRRCNQFFKPRKSADISNIDDVLAPELRHQSGRVISAMQPFTGEEADNDNRTADLRTINSSCKAQALRSGTTQFCRK